MMYPEEAENIPKNCNEKSVLQKDRPLPQSYHSFLALEFKVCLFTLKNINFNPGWYGSVH